MTAYSSEERQLLHDSIEDYFSGRYPAGHAVRLSRSEPDGFGREHWSDYAKLGWLGLGAPEEAGGHGGGLTEAGILFAAAGRHLAQEPLIGTLALGAGAILRFGGGTQGDLLKGIVAGERMPAFLHYESDSGFDRGRVTTVATPHDGGFALSGSKAFALGAHAADTLVVSARIGDGNGPVALFLVPGDAPGVARAAAPCLDGRHGAAVSFREVALPDGARLGGEEDRLAEIDRLLDRAALATCAEAVGAMAAVAGITTEYLKTREQFGSPLSSFQVLQHRVVDMHLLAEQCRAMVHVALDAADRGAPDAARTIWLTKVKVAQASRFVGAQGVQLHGGMGMTDDLSIGHYYKRLAMCEALFGDADWHLDRLAETAPELA